jgi:hypothetical protein
MRSAAGRALRRAGLVPGGTPDGLGDDDRLGDLVLRTRAVVFFPDPPENLYQLRQWYPALEELDRAMGVTILTQDSRSTRAIRAETPLPVHAAALTRTVGALLESGDVALVLYVGQANANAVALRSPRVAHVFLNHGESDKWVSISNQVKSFDFAFVGGQASVDRHHNGLLMFNASERLYQIGRPQAPDATTPAGPTTVLYAPTWEGTQAINAYSSVKAFGHSLVKSLIDTTDYRIVYRPHPRTGTSDRSYRQADAAIRKLIAGHGARARVDATATTAAALQGAHVLVSDVSAIATDWLTQRRPLITTTPADPRARIAAPARIQQLTPHIGMDNAEQAGEVVTTAVSDTSTATVMDELFNYYLSGLHAKESQSAFIDACSDVATRRDQALAQREGARG